MKQEKEGGLAKGGGTDVPIEASVKCLSGLVYHNHSSD